MEHSEKILPDLENKICSSLQFAEIMPGQA